MQASKFTVKTLSRVTTPPTSSSEPQTVHARARLRELTRELRQLEEKLRLGGGPDKIDKQHKQGKLTARERLDLLFDKDTYRQEIGLLVAYDQYKPEVRGQRSEVRG
ncbi:MAG TPA: hypothetical protein DC054_26575, partial [Blastocatellia bacterium]|nr:hypothetical protein [Blastocatellia bacterium]